MNIVKLSEHEFRHFNKLLVDNYGYYENQPKFRLVWSDDVIEKRLTKYTKDGFELLTPEIRELPKYRQYIQSKYVIEMITFIGDNLELGVNQLGYEPFYTFEDRNQEFLIPKWSAAKVIIDSMLEIAGVKKAAQYKLDNDTERQQLIKRVDELEEALYGNESKIGDSLMRDSAVGYGTRQRNDGFSPEEKLSKSNKVN